MKPNSSRAFTLLELLLSLAVMAALFAAMSQFIFSMGELWGRGAERRLFEQHVTAVTHHLQLMITAASSAPAESMAIAEAPLAGAPALLKMELPAGDRALSGVGPPEADVVSYLQVEPEHGLKIHWRSQRSADAGDRELRASVLSRFGSGIAYEYYDRVARRLMMRDSPVRDETGQWLRPCRIQLRFAWNDLKATRAVVVPTSSGGLPDF